MAASQAERSAKAAAKRKALGEEEIRFRARQGVRDKIRDLMERHGFEEQAELIQLLIINAHAASPEESSKMLSVPRHEIKISPNVARKLAEYIPPSDEDE